MEKEYRWLYNMVCEWQTSRLEVTQEMLKILWLENDIKITEVSSDYFAKEYFAPRPWCERLIDKRLTLRWCNIMRDRKVALKEYLGNEYQDLFK